MSVLGGDQGEPSSWAAERFGRHASRLVEAIPEQLARGHTRAHAVHLAARLKKRSPYGSTFAEAVRENLADIARELEEAVRDLRGYEYAVINDHALFPFKYANRLRPLERARLAADASPTCRRMLLSHGPDPEDGLFLLDDEYATEEYGVCTRPSRRWVRPRSWCACSSPPTRRAAST
ncbi:hypothetical protein ACF1AU_36405 [Streptomyces rubrogriseus]|uniref:hypothetical protein n=1 Tax=Streptomyces rubrogriseus TaxID=194673 RepID=UPI0036F9AB9A